MRTKEEIKATELAIAITSAIGELEKCAVLYKQIFPNDLVCTRIDFREIKGYVVDARQAIKREILLKGEAQGENWMCSCGAENFPTLHRCQSLLCGKVRIDPVVIQDDGSGNQVTASGRVLR